VSGCPLTCSRTEGAVVDVHSLVDRFLGLPVGVQILLLVLSLPGGALLLGASLTALRRWLQRRER
jgi:hypothetical protein